MAQKLSIEYFVTMCGGVTRLADLWSLSTEYLGSQGIRIVDYNTTERVRQGTHFSHIVQKGFPDAWVKHYVMERLRRFDPIPKTAMRLQRPFLWSQTGSFWALRPEQQDFLEERARNVPGDGLVIPVYGPNMLNACVGFGFGDRVPDLSDREIFNFQTVAQMGHLRYCEITRERRQKTDLSPREIDVLRWIVRGKSNSVIAEILGISRHTVDTMTRRMFDKLHVHDRTSAAVLAMGSGLIDRPIDTD
ncbi:putative HTH-type transcriptional regulator, LuxR family [Sulfitobacter noctilucae]|uniref:helix-turn-helix transcriptional regulator n=1 Tax=Sulfitobacter noctilucae TaxID=1342302 RepID=UPI00046A2950|nr:LuxR family transcriptional regulator [Sulfitobacter noctilucae]KIN70852.1 putative HTH-type transcriptional regulator, LuxR family [Sulfitobacter noctilucae]